MGAASRRKGAVGQSEFARMLADRDWQVDPITCGIMREDMIATDPDGNKWAVEVKNTRTITPAHRKQAQDQAKRRGLRWMLANKVFGTGAWLVQRQGIEVSLWK